MVYRWAVEGLYDIDAETAAKELERIRERRGGLRAAAVVEESADPSAPLHGCFEWDDAVAAQRHREAQAAAIIRAIVVDIEAPKSSEPVTVRAFVREDSGYAPLREVCASVDRYDLMLSQARREMEAFVAKYSGLVELEKIVEEANAFLYA